MIQMENNLVMDMKSAATKKKEKKQSSNRGSRNRGGGNYKGISEPMRVVYISNPMKFEIRASEFRRLVQQLTGRDAEFPPSLRRHHINPPAAAASNSSSDSSSNCSSLTTTTTATVDSSVGGGHNVAPSPEEEDHDAPPLAVVGVAVVGEVEDEDQWDDGEFAPEMLENTAVFHSWHFDLDFAQLINS